MDKLSKLDDYTWDSTKDIKGGEWNETEIINRIGMMLADDWGGRGLYESSVMSNLNEGMKNNKKFFSDETSHWYKGTNLLKSFLQEELMKQSGYPEGDYGLYSSHWEKENLEDKKYSQKASSTKGITLKDLEGITSLLMPEVKVNPYAKTSKGYNVNTMKIIPLFEY